MSKIKIETIASKAAAILFLGLIAYLPVHIFVSTVIGANFGGLELFKASKDIAVAVIGFLLLPYMIKNRDMVIRVLFKDWLGIMSISYIAVHLLFFVLYHQDLDSAALGLLYNTRYIVMLLLVLILSRAEKEFITSYIIAKIVVISSAAVGVVGVLQYYVLPENFFEKLGYSMKNGALPWFYIDGKPDFPRIMSTMRDPNSLGSYLLIPLSLVGAKLLICYRSMSIRMRYYAFGIIGLLIVALILAFSRSGIVGLIITVVTSIVLANEEWIKRNFRKVLSLGVIALIIVVGAGVIFMQTNPRTFKNVVFHADEQTSFRDPNELRVDFLKRSIKEIVHRPFGSGLGTAGLASMKNDIKGVNLTENYYLQLALEVGVVGLGLFLAICSIVVIRLHKIWYSERGIVPLALIASFAGLFVTNMLAHIWTNETIALIWWSLAAVCLAEQPIKSGVKKA